MYYKTVLAKRSRRKVRLVINEVVKDGKPSYFANVVFREMDFFISLTLKEKKKLCRHS